MRQCQNMPIYKDTAITAKVGVNFVRSTVEACGSLFIKIEQENDLGIDAIIEFVQNGRPLNKQIAVQIKSGSSYFLDGKEECVFPVGNHRDYWQNYPLPVFGLVFVPEHKAAYWGNIKRFLEAHPKATKIRFAATEANRFDSDNFTKLFLPSIVGKTPSFAFDEALRLAQSPKVAEASLGLLVLFRRFPNRTTTWDELISTFRTRPPEEIPPALIHWIAHIPWHGDIAYFGEPITSSTRAYAREQLAEFNLQDVVRLLSFIDSENGIARGTIGQSVEAIISSLPDCVSMLKEIIRADKFDLEIREHAALIFAMQKGAESISDLETLAKAGSSYMKQVIEHIKQYGAINPY